MRNLRQTATVEPDDDRGVEPCPSCGHGIETDHECPMHRRCPDTGDATVCDHCMLIVRRSADGTLVEATAEEAEAAITAEPVDGWSLSDQLDAIANDAVAPPDDDSADDYGPDDDDGEFDASKLQIEEVPGGFVIEPFPY